MDRDGHIHSPFCPHGTKDTFEQYIEQAIKKGFKEITFAEHAPLPDGFTDPTPARDSAMSWDNLEHYLSEISRVKLQYQGQIKIHAGLEIDFIEGYEDKTRDFLNEIGPRLDDSILSVHFLKSADFYHCMDYSPSVFGEMVRKYGSVNNVYTKYYETLLLSINSDLGPYKPKRIGHITLVHKFQKKFPPSVVFNPTVLNILHTIKEQGYELDYNGAGTAKPLCKEPYPPDWVVKEVRKLKIPLIYGSDAHQAKEIGQGLEQILIG